MQLPRSSCTPQDVLIKDDALDAGQIEWLKESIAQSTMTDSLVSNVADESPADAEWIINKNVRDTQEVKLASLATQRLNASVEASARKLIEPFFRIEVRDWEPVQVLHYARGGHYIPHVDAETLYKDEIGLEMWEKTLDRDLSIVYFLNDDFAGGELFFPVFDLQIKPKAGTLVCFPSDHHFVHGVKPVTSGRRYTAVTWLRVQGTASPEEINQRWLAEYERAWPEQIEQPSPLARSSRIPK
jgi:predicted 2-oxoglutarate/Fe(II)-dependent dioxygenase YbiX